MTESPTHSQEPALPGPADEVCAWFAACTNPADGTVEHPVLGQVPTCRRCADKLSLELQR